MNPSLLIVEPRHLALDVLTARFLDAGYHVVGVNHPRQALEAASHERFHVCLLDEAQPDMSGLDLLDRIRKFQRHLSAIIIAGGDDESRAVPTGDDCRVLPRDCTLNAIELAVEDALLSNPEWTVTRA